MAPGTATKGEDLVLIEARQMLEQRQRKVDEAPDVFLLEDISTHALVGR